MSTALDLGATIQVGNDDELLTAKQLRKWLGFSEAYIYTKAKKGHIPSILVARKRLFYKSQITKWLKVQKG